MALQSYVLQEAEAVARYQKLSWCAAEGREVMSLQHDGIIVRRKNGDDGKEVAQRMTTYVSDAAGYDVQIKQVQEYADGDEEWDLPPLMSTGQ